MAVDDHALLDKERVTGADAEETSVARGRCRRPNGSGPTPQNMTWTVYGFTGDYATSFRMTDGWST